MKELAGQGKVTQLIATGNRDTGWLISVTFNDDIWFLHAAGTNSPRVIKTELALYKLIKKVGCAATLTDLEFIMKNTAIDMAAMFAVAQLNLDANNLSLLSKDVVMLYRNSIMEKCDLRVTEDDLISAVKEYIVDTALFTSKLNTQCLSAETSEVKPLSLLWTHLHSLGNIHSAYQSQVESVLANLKSEHLQ